MDAAYEKAARVSEISTRGMAQRPQAKRMAAVHDGAPGLPLAHRGTTEGSCCRPRHLGRANAWADCSTTRILGAWESSLGHHWRREWTGSTAFSGRMVQKSSGLVCHRWRALLLQTVGRARIGPCTDRQEAGGPGPRWA